MKKMVTAALAASMVMSVAGSAMAAASFPEFSFNGDLKVHYRWNDDYGTKNDGGKYFFRLNAQSELSKDVDVYARLAIEQLVGGNKATGGLADFSTGEYGTSATSFDRYGFILKGKDFNYTIGRQDAILGQGLIIDSTGYMGVDVGAFDGLTAQGKTGATNLKVIAGQAWSSNELFDAKVYAIDASYSPAKNWTIGGTVAKVTMPAGAPIDDGTFYAVNAAYTAGKANIFAEYGKSDYDIANKGYAFGVSYAADKKNSVFAIYNKVEENANINGLTTYDSNGKGMYYGFGHKFDSRTNLDLFYKSMKTIATTIDHPADTKYDSFRATVTYKF